MALPLLLGACGTLVQVLDEHGVPVQGASVRVVYPSIAGGEALTDSSGHARLADHLFARPLFFTPPR